MKLLGFIVIGIILVTIPGFLVFKLWLGWSTLASILCGFLVSSFLMSTFELFDEIPFIKKKKKKALKE